MFDHLQKWNAAFVHFLLLDRGHKSAQKAIFHTISYRDVAQMVARLVWEQVTAPKFDRAEKRQKPL
jgi:hypothetical protein